jgi:hypothetical protein
MNNIVWTKSWQECNKLEKNEQHSFAQNFDKFCFKFQLERSRFGDA